MKISLPTALVLSLIALSCTKPGLNSGQEAELRPRPSPVQVGELAPDFTLEDQNGQKVKLSDLQKDLKAAADSMGMGADFQLSEVKGGL